MRIAAKFGGTSVADGDRVRNAASIVRSNPDRCVIVVSAQGKRTPDDPKMTDMLLSLCDESSRVSTLDLIKSRVVELARELEVSEEILLIIHASLKELSEHLSEHGCDDYVVSRGEYWSALLMAAVLGPEWEFVDASELIRFKDNGSYDRDATASAFARKLPERFVMPGFYGTTSGGQVRVFTRNGSDISGAIAARFTGCDVYENWTDTEGVRACDPRIVATARNVFELTREELGELAYRGASVLHADALFPLEGSPIEVRVRSTLAPEGTWTRVVLAKTNLRRATREPVVGIAGRNGISFIDIVRPGMQRDIGFLARLCSIFAENKLSIEQAPGSLTTQTVLVDTRELRGKEHAILDAIRAEWPEASTKVRQGHALVCVVGATMEHQHGIAARIFSCLSRSQINVSTIEQGASEVSIIIGVASQDYEKATQVLAREFGLTVQ